MEKVISGDLVIVLAGEAGQGIQAIEGILSSILKRSGYNFFSTSEFMSRVRGGTNSTEIRVSSEPAAGFLDRIDILIPLHDSAIKHLGHRITPKTIVIGDREKISYRDIIDIHFAKIAAETGNVIYTNTVAAGFICGLLKIGEHDGEQFILDYFRGKKEEIRIKNAEAFKLGYLAGEGLPGIKIDIQKSDNVKNQMVLSGADSIALGAIAGGCDYVCGYPMSPSTSVLEKMASYSRKFDIIVEQVEDEVGVVNMALGAWYAGARAFVTTSGGGFALMCEGISLCGMIESPLVLHLAQRPGPATGLPTRTEQGDLNLVLYAGHGEFPRIILAPGTLEEGFLLTQKAFSLSDEFQVPVFILTDQYYVDSSYNTPVFRTDGLKNRKHIIETAADYKRFAFTANGISPRGIPGYGKGNVCADSDEHNESGYIIEDSETRIKMVNKRIKKAEAVRSAIIEPVLTGDENFSTLVICWGSTGNITGEAVRKLGDKKIAVLHFSWIYPLSDSIEKYLKKASNIIIVENNSSAQFAQLVRLKTGVLIENRILKFDGRPFSVEEVMREIKKYL